MDVSLKVFGYNKDSGIEFLSLKVSNMQSSYMPTTITAVQIPVVQGNQLQVQKTVEAQEEEVIEEDAKTLVLANPNSKPEQLQVEQNVEVESPIQVVEVPAESKKAQTFRAIVEEAESAVDLDNGGANSNTLTTERTVEVKQTMKSTSVNSNNPKAMVQVKTKRLRSFGLPRFDPVGLAKAIVSKIHDVRFLSDEEVYALVNS